MCIRKKNRSLKADHIFITDYLENRMRKDPWVDECVHDFIKTLREGGPTLTSDVDFSKKVFSDSIFIAGFHRVHLLAFWEKTGKTLTATVMIYENDESPRLYIPPKEETVVDKLKRIFKKGEE